MGWIMPVCNECHIEVRTKDERCPVCGNALEGINRPLSIRAKNNYPDHRSQLATYGLLRRVLKVTTVFVCLFSALVNLLLTPMLWWSVLVLGAAMYGWLVVPAWMRRNANVVRVLAVQVVLTSIAVVLVDFVTGYRGWSMDYVVPSLLIAGIVCAALIIILDYRHWSYYVFYQVLICLFGISPLLFYFLNISHNLPLVLVSVGLGLAGLVATLGFADKSIKNEFIKRFHI